MVVLVAGQGADEVLPVLPPGLSSIDAEPMKILPSWKAPCDARFEAFIVKSQLREEPARLLAEGDIAAAEGEDLICLPPGLSEHDPKEVVPMSEAELAQYEEYIQANALWCSHLRAQDALWAECWEYWVDSGDAAAWYSCNTAKADCCDTKSLASTDAMSEGDLLESASDSCADSVDQDA